MPPEELAAFPERKKPADKFQGLFDGKVWKLDPTEYDYDGDEAGCKQMVAALKAAAYKQKVYIRTFIGSTFYVIVQKQPDDYVPKRAGRPRRMLLCEHANERPNICPCPPTCACHETMCK